MEGQIIILTDALAYSKYGNNKIKPVSMNNCKTNWKIETLAQWWCVIYAFDTQHITTSLVSNHPSTVSWEPMG